MNSLLARIRQNQTLSAVIGAAIVAIILLALSAGFTRGTANQLTSLLLLATLATAWNLVGGFGGQFSLGHSIFVGMGAYGTAVILTYLGWPLPVAVLLAGVASAIIGVLLAYPLLRLRGPYLAVGSLGMALAAYGWMVNWDFTGASSSFPLPDAGMLGVKDLYVWAVVLAAVAFIVTVITVRSPLGLKLIALRDDEAGAASVGVYRVRTLLPVWAISGLLTGLMGALFALQRGSLTADLAFTTQLSLDAAIVCVIGGLGTMSGPLIGAVLVYYLRFYAADYSSLSLLIEAVVLIVIVRFFPGGIVGLISRIATRFKIRNGPVKPSVLTGSFTQLS
ncbi:MAG: branched-chain amino acid ABC transporter permease [Microbacteriaceae bacterium]